jgi:molybdopterin converting factor small subunit
VHIEFFGIPRERTGVTEVELDAGRFGDALDQLVERYPPFAALMDGARLHASVIASLNADTFISDPDTPLTPADRVLILSADAGG